MDPKRLPVIEEKIGLCPMLVDGDGKVHRAMTVKDIEAMGYEPHGYANARQHDVDKKHIKDLEDQVRDMQVRGDQYFECGAATLDRAVQAERALQEANKLIEEKAKHIKGLEGQRDMLLVQHDAAMGYIKVLARTALHSPKTRTRNVWVNQDDICNNKTWAYLANKPRDDHDIPATLCWTEETQQADAKQPKETP